MTYHTSGVLFKNTFGTPEMRKIVSERRFIQRFLDAEAALARAEADVGVIPEWAAQAITAGADVDTVDLERVESYVAEIGLFTMSIIEAWEEELGPEGEYVHWGATSQDISDIAMLLVLREATDVIERDHESVIDRLLTIAEAHAETPMIGRTHYVHAIPITAGLKVAGWADELSRHRDRLSEAEQRLFELQFFGATGTLASLGTDGLAIQEALAEELDLTVPNLAWYAARDRFVEFITTIGHLAGSIARIARQILMLNRPEIHEFREPIPDSAVGSSTMPHKRNPVRSQTVLGLSKLLRGLVSTGLALLDGYDERDYSTWVIEFAILPQICLYMARMLTELDAVLAELTIDTESLASNLDIYGGLVASEAVMMRLAEDIGRQTAHDAVGNHAKAALNGGPDFLERLCADDTITDHLSPEELATLTDPRTYTGEAEALTLRTISNLSTTSE